MDIVIRASVLFIFLWVVLRALGKRELGELTPFELVLLICMGDLIQQGVTQEDFSVTGAMLAVGTIALWILAISYTGFRSRNARSILEGLPAVVVHNGELDRQAMKMERLAEDELLDAAREQGIEQISDVRYGILEPDGEFSFIKYSSDQPKPGKAAKDMKA